MSIYQYQILLLLAAKQEPYKKAYLSTKKLKNFLEKVQENGPVGRKKTERVTGLGRKTRDSKVESNVSPEIPDRGGGKGGEREDIRHPRPPFGVITKATFQPK